MREQPKNKLLNLFIPSISEFEFIFFVSLLLSSVIGYFAITYIQHPELFVLQLAKDNFAIIIAFIFLASGLIQMAYTASRSSQPSVKKVDRARMVFIPSMFIVFFALTNRLFINNQQSNPNLLAQTINAIFLIRSGVVLIINKFFDDSTYLQDQIGGLLETYQMNGKDCALAVGLGVATSSIVLLSNNWFFWFMVVYSTGELFIRYYRSPNAI